MALYVIYLFILLICTFSFIYKWRLNLLVIYYNNFIKIIKILLLLIPMFIMTNDVFTDIMDIFLN